MLGFGPRLDVGRGGWKLGADADARRWWGRLALEPDGKITGGTLNSFAIDSDDPERE